jgi:hypothetical protein
VAIDFVLLQWGLTENSINKTVDTEKQIFGTFFKVK